MKDFTKPLLAHYDRYQAQVAQFFAGVDPASSTQSLHDKEVFDRWSAMWSQLAVAADQTTPSTSVPPTPAPPAAPDSAPAPAPVVPLPPPVVRVGDLTGFNAWPTQVAAEQTGALGAKWIRFAYEGQWGSWKTFIPKAIKTCHAAGIKALVQVMGVPGMNRRAFALTDAQRAAYADFALFCADSGADLIEFWNEQNGDVFTDANADPKLYVPMVVGAYTRVKATHPNLDCISGGYTPFGPPRDPVSWDTACKKVSVEFDDCRDGIGHHPYNWGGTNPITDSVKWNAFAQTVVLKTFNLIKNIYITEIGSPAGGGSTSRNEPYTEERQAQWFDLYNRGIDLWPFTPRLTIWHTLYDGDKGIGTPVEPYFGIVRANGADKPITEKFRARAAQLAH